MIEFVRLAVELSGFIPRLIGPFKSRTFLHYDLRNLDVVLFLEDG